MSVADDTDQTEQPSESYLPALFRHCKTFYNAMAELAEHKEEGLIWVGNTTDLFTESGLHLAQYTNVTRRLQAMNCLNLVRRGGGPSPSVWCLLREPTVELFDNAQSRTKTTRRITPGSKEQLLQHYRDLSKRLEAIESWARSQGAPI